MSNKHANKIILLVATLFNIEVVQSTPGPNEGMRETAASRLREYYAQQLQEPARSLLQENPRRGQSPSSLWGLPSLLASGRGRRAPSQCPLLHVQSSDGGKAVRVGLDAEADHSYKAGNFEDLHNALRAFSKDGIAAVTFLKEGVQYLIEVDLGSRSVKVRDSIGRDMSSDALSVEGAPLGVLPPDSDEYTDPFPELNLKLLLWSVLVNGQDPSLLQDILQRLEEYHESEAAKVKSHLEGWEPVSSPRSKGIKSAETPETPKGAEECPKRSTFFEKASSCFRGFGRMAGDVAWSLGKTAGEVARKAAASTIDFAQQASEQAFAAFCKSSEKTFDTVWDSSSHFTRDATKFCIGSACKLVRSAIYYTGYYAYASISYCATSLVNYIMGW